MRRRSAERSSAAARSRPKSCRIVPPHLGRTVCPIYALPGTRKPYRRFVITPRTERVDRTDHRHIDDGIEQTEAKEPTENSDAADPIDPIDRKDPTEAIDRAEPFDAIDRNESSDHRDHVELFEAISAHLQPRDVPRFPSAEPVEPCAQ
jgi:hypothetical protein